MQQPTTTAAGSAISPAVTVAVEDAFGNIEAGDNATTVTLALGTTAPGAFLAGGGATTVTAGVASFAGLSVDLVGAGDKLDASGTAPSTPATSSPFTITDGPVSHLVFVQQPTTTAAGSSISPAVTVAVEDAFGNVETGDNATKIAVGLGADPAGGTLSGGGVPGIATVTNGVATFSGLSIDKAGAGYTLAAVSSPTDVPATSAPFAVTPGTPTQLVFMQQPTTTAAGSAISPAVTVAVEDAFGNIEAGDNATVVSIASGTNPANGTLTGGASVPVTNGVATFAGLSVDKVALGDTLSATSAPSNLSMTSGAFDVEVGAPAKLAFVQQPASSVAGSTLNPAVSVALEDAQGNVETGDNSTVVTLALGTSAGNGSLAGGTAVAVSHGVATFGGLSIDRVGVGDTLSATSAPAVTPATSTTFDVSPGPAAELAFVQQPAATPAGSVVNPTVTVALEDALGNVETGDSTSTVILGPGANPPGGTLNGGGAVTVSHGVATYPALSISTAGTGYTLTASSPPYTVATSATFDVGAPISHLVFVQDPTAVSAGASLAPAVMVAVEDASGNVETTDNSTSVSLALTTGPGTLSGGAPVTVSGGIATFSGLSIDKAGSGDTLAAASSPAAIQAASAPFDVTPGPATQLAFAQQPTSTTAGATIDPAVTVDVEDADGNVETGDSSTTVTLALAAISGHPTLSGGGAVTVSHGVATFAALSVDKTGDGDALTASSGPSYTGATSTVFSVAVGAPALLAFVRQPSALTAGSVMAPSVAVAVEDAFGNVETGDDSSTVSLALDTTSGTGALAGGGPVTTQGGIATFDGLSVDRAGKDDTLAASSSPSYVGAASVPFAVTPGPATQLAFVQQPTTVTAGSPMAPAVTVAVEDANGNLETADDSTQVTLAIGTNPGGGSLGSGSATTVSSGIASFPGLSVDEIGAGYTLSASSAPAYTAATSAGFDVTSGQLGLSCAPTSAPAAPCQGIELPAVTLEGTTQTAQAPAGTLYVTDNRGLAAAGWSVSAYLVPTAGNANPACSAVATFCNATVGSSAADPDGQIPASDLSVGWISCSAAGGNSSPQPEAGVGGAFPAGPGAVSLCSAGAGHSSGTFKLGATYSLKVPGGVYAGKYDATVEYLAF